MDDDDFLIWQEPLGRTPPENRNVYPFLGESEAIRKVKQKLLQGLQVDPKLLTEQMSLGGQFYLKHDHPSSRRE